MNNSRKTSIVIRSAVLAAALIALLLRVVILLDDSLLPDDVVQYRSFQSADVVSFGLEADKRSQLRHDQFSDRALIRGSPKSVLSQSVASLFGLQILWGAYCLTDGHLLDVKGREVELLFPWRIRSILLGVNSIGVDLESELIIGVYAKLQFMESGAMGGGGDSIVVTMAFGRGGYLIVDVQPRAEASLWSVILYDGRVDVTRGVGAR